MKTIDSEKFYNLNEIERLGLFPWISSYGAIRRYVDYDAAHDNILQAQIKPAHTPSGVRYFIRGENIIKLLVKYEDGSLFLNYASKGQKNARSSEDSQGRD